MACTAGVAIYNIWLRSVSLKKVFFWTALTMIAADLAQVVLVTGTLSIPRMLDTPCRGMSSNESPAVWQQGTTGRWAYLTKPTCCSMGRLTRHWGASRSCHW
jgi:hypothetical protein